MIDTILFLGVNDIQKSALLNARYYGFNCVGIDINRNAKSKRFCDVFLNIDCTNISQVYAQVKALKVNVKAIWANNDILITSRLVLSYLFGLHDTSIKTGIILLDKLSFRGLVGHKDYLIPWDTFSKKDESPLGYPVIIKPYIGSGSQGIKIINNPSEYDAINFENPVIIEKYIPGDEVGINIFKTDRSTHRLGAVYRYFDHISHHVPIGTITEYDQNLLDKAYGVLEDFIADIEYYGMAKADILIDNHGKHYLIELSSRFHGEIDTEYIFSNVNYSLSKKYFGYVKNGIIADTPFKDDHHYGYISLFLKGCTTVPQIDLSGLPTGDFHGMDILSYMPHRYCGDSINLTPQSTYDIVVFAIFKSKIKYLNDEFLVLSKLLNKEFEELYGKND